MPKLSRVKETKYTRPAVNPGRWCNRTWCATLDDMRRLFDTSKVKQNVSTREYETMQAGGVDISLLPTSVLFMVLNLIEELQVYGNRMEAGLGDKRDYREMVENRKTLKKEIDELEKKRDKLKQ